MKIFIVEDDYASRKMLEKFLEPLGEIYSAADGNDAIEIFDQELDTGKNFDLICLDIMLPGKSGQDILKHIRSREYKAGIYGLQGSKVIMTTALSDPPNIIEAFHEQCEAYVTKPIKKEDLYKEIEKLGIISGT